MSSSSSTAKGRTLEAKGLTKRFGARAALKAVSFELEPGELVGIVGPNGAGKTTLLSILAGVLEPDEGQLSRSTSEIGWVPQQLALYSKLSVTENLRLFARLEKLTDPEAAVARMLAQTALAERAEEEVGRLSAGNRQRVNIAIGLLASPSVLLLDEPSAALDPRQRERLWEFISARAEAGTTVIFSTHNVAEVERYATRVLLLADGELLFTGTPRELEGAVAVGTPAPGASAPVFGRDLESSLLHFLHQRGH